MLANSGQWMGIYRCQQLKRRKSLRVHIDMEVFHLHVCSLLVVWLHYNRTLRVQGPSRQCPGFLLAVSEGTIAAAFTALEKVRSVRALVRRPSRVGLKEVSR
jgi:hypothetical protein